jgi:tripartite-type tricarboxylate transporter receptor subunit TctC
MEIRDAVIRIVFLALCVLAGLAGPAIAQPYPSRPVRVIVPWPVGGGTDMLARPIAQKLSERLGQQVVVDNRGGASGIVGSEIAAKAPADGYHLLIDNVTSHSTNLSLYPKLPYNSMRDFAPVTLISTAANIVVVHPSVQAKSLGELISLAKSRPGALSFASYGTGGTTHLAGEMLKGLAGIDMVHVPYRGGGPATIDALAGQVPVYFCVLVTCQAQVRAGKLRGLAVTGLQRDPVFPEVPTVAESGFPGFEANNWYGLLVPAGVPQEIVQRLATETHTVLRTPDVSERLTAMGNTIVVSTPERMREHMAAETEKWAKVIKAANVKVE